MLELKNIRKHYIINRKANICVDAIGDISLLFHNIGLTTIVGRSGSGKTTLLNIIGGIDKPTAGEVMFQHKDITIFSNLELDNFRNHSISYIFQEYNLLHEYNAIDNVKVAIRLQETNEKTIDEKAKIALKEVGLEGFEQRRIYTLSGGQQQRVVIARALAKDSNVLLCDEPTGNLDSKTSIEIIKLFKVIAEKRLVILVTHDNEIAEKYSDRIISLKDGNIEYDRVLNENTIFIPDNVPGKHSYYGLTVKDSLVMIKDNIQHSFIFTFTILILIMSALTLTSVFGSLMGYDAQSSFVYTLQENEQYVLQITKYVDRPIIIPIEGIDTISHGPQIYYEDAKIEDIEELYQLVDNKANFYESYFFYKNFNDFIDRFIDIDTGAFMYVQNHFREAIVVDDFSRFHLKLLYGSLPIDDSDVLIYDYMVYSLIENGILFGTIQSNINSVLIDQQTGLNLKIVGILKSDYERYSYIQDKTGEYGFEETYLTSLQTIYCKREFIDSLTVESPIHSIVKTFIVNAQGQNLTFIDTNIKKAKYVNTQNPNLIATIDGYELERGIFLSLDRVASILDIQPSLVTEQMLDEFMINYSISGYEALFDWSVERTLYYPFMYPIIGIYDDANIDQQMLVFHEPDLDQLRLLNASFRQIYLSLGTNWETNKEVLDHFIYPLKTEEFYTANPDYYDEGYVDYNAYGILIQNSNYYLLNVKAFAEDLLWILVSITIVGIVFFSSYNIKKYNYKIGILKSLGTKNKDIAIIFGLQIALIGVTAFIFSIPASYILMHRINENFVKTIHSGLVFFSMQTGILVTLFFGSIALIVVSSSMSLIKLFLMSPMEIIRSTKRQ